MPDVEGTLVGVQASILDWQDPGILIGVVVMAATNMSASHHSTLTAAHFASISPVIILCRGRPTCSLLAYSNACNLPVAQQ